jgi:hypothetical protein
MDWRNTGRDDMTTPAKLDVSRWQVARPQWHYTPVLWFYWRMVEAALFDVRCDSDGRPTDQALLVRDWVARSEPTSVVMKRRFVSFPECCQMLGLNTDNERVALLEMIDKLGDFDTDEAWERLEILRQLPMKDDPDPLFKGLRFVPVLDQLNLFVGNV